MMTRWWPSRLSTAEEGNQCWKRRMCLRAQPTADKVEEDPDVNDDDGDGDDNDDDYVDGDVDDDNDHDDYHGGDGNDNYVQPTDSS